MTNESTTQEPAALNDTPDTEVELVTAPPAKRRRFTLDDRGQATTEYALVLLAAALVGLLVIGWATAGGGAAAIGGLFNRVIASVASKI